MSPCRSEGPPINFNTRRPLDHLHAGSTPVTPLDLVPPGGSRQEDYDDNTTASTRLGYTVAPGFDLNLVGRFTDAHYAFTDDPTLQPSEQSKSDTSQYYTRFSGHLDSFDGVLDQTLGIAYSSAWTSNQDPELGNSGKYWRSREVRLARGPCASPLMKRWYSTRSTRGTPFTNQ